MKVNEIFVGINGEVNHWHQGSPAVFVRLQRCNLNCRWCDAPQARLNLGGSDMTVDQLINRIMSYNIDRVTITGGEPLLQPWTADLIINLAKREIDISVETNGSMPISSIYSISYGAKTLSWLRDVRWVVDYKLEFERRMILANYLLLSKYDWIKFVIANDYELTRFNDIRAMLKDQGCIARYALSPVNADLALGKTICDWICFNRASDTILNLQIHKIIGVK